MVKRYLEDGQVHFVFGKHLSGITKSDSLYTEVLELKGLGDGSTHCLFCGIEDPTFAITLIRYPDNLQIPIESSVCNKACATGTASELNGVFVIGLGTSAKREIY